MTSMSTSTVYISCCGIHVAFIGRSVGLGLYIVLLDTY